MLRKLLSRKFLVAVGTIVVKTLFPETPSEVLAVAGAYILGESAVDAANAKR